MEEDFAGLLDFANLAEDLPAGFFEAFSGLPTATFFFLEGTVFLAGVLFFTTAPLLFAGRDFEAAGFLTAFLGGLETFFGAFFEAAFDEDGLREGLADDFFFFATMSNRIFGRGREANGRKRRTQGFLQYFLCVA